MPLSTRGIAVSSASAHGSETPAPDPHELMSDDGLFRLIAVGMLSGTPFLFIMAFGIAFLSGVGLGNALAIGAIPALFGGITAGGFVGMMRFLLRQDKALAADRVANAAGAARASALATAKAA
jgi:hypothetical protein